MKSIYSVATLIVLAACQTQPEKPKPVQAILWDVTIDCPSTSALGSALITATAHVFLKHEGVYVGRIVNSVGNSGLFGAVIEENTLKIRVEYPGVAPIRAVLFAEDKNQRLLGQDSNGCGLAIDRPEELRSL
ncbi:MAG: hypothetical protein V3U96_06565 [Paracoccaceae bacterium]